MNDHGFHPQTKRYIYLVQHNKQYLTIVLLNSFHLNDHTVGCRHSKDRTTLYSITNSNTGKYYSVALI